MNDIEKQLEAVLFVRGEPLARGELLKLLGIDVGVLDHALESLAARLVGGIRLINDGREVELRTAPEAAPLIEMMQKEELSRDIGKAGLETLAILLYKGPSTRSEIDYVRGVNSSHILRVLAMRGLVRRVEHPKDDRSYLYEPTTELLASLGKEKREDLPEFENLMNEIGALYATKDEHAELSS